MDAESAFETADHATDSPADNRADRSCRIVSNGRAVRNPVRNPLRVRCERSNKQRRDGACE